MFFHGAYTDFLLRDYKPRKKPTILHRKTCPICARSLVNIYYSNQLDKYICKECMDKLLGKKGGEE